MWLVLPFLSTTYVESQDIQQSWACVILQHKINMFDYVLSETEALYLVSLFGHEYLVEWCGRLQWLLKWKVKVKLHSLLNESVPN